MKIQRSFVSCILLGVLKLIFSETYLLKIKVKQNLLIRYFFKDAFKKNEDDNHALYVYYLL